MRAAAAKLGLEVVDIEQRSIEIIEGFGGEEIYEMLYRLAPVATVEIDPRDVRVNDLERTVRNLDRKFDKLLEALGEKTRGSEAMERSPEPQPRTLAPPRVVDVALNLRERHGKPAQSLRPETAPPYRPRRAGPPTHGDRRAVPDLAGDGGDRRDR